MPRVLAALILALLLLGAGQAAELSPTVQQYLLPYAQWKLDAAFSQWPKPGEAIVIDPALAAQDPRIQPLPGDATKPIRGSQDLSAKAWLAWDEKYLYIAAQVTDDELVGIKPGTENDFGPHGWYSDSFMTVIHSFRHPLQANTPYHRSPFMAARLTIPEGGRGTVQADLGNPARYPRMPKGTVLYTRQTAAGYDVQAAVPWAELGFPAQEGEPLFLGFLLADHDPGGRFNQLGWRFSENPGDWALFRLAKRTEALGLLTLSRDTVAPGAPLQVQYRVDALTTPVQVEAVELAGPERKLVTLPVKVQVGKGQTGSDVLNVGKAPAPVGTWEARLVATVGGKQAVLAQEAFAVATPSAAGPAISNPPGELHRMRPDRAVHTAAEDHSLGLIRHGFITDKSGYERYILTHVKEQIDKRMETEIRNRNTWLCDPIIECAAIYKLTGDEKYADWCRRGIDALLSLRKEELPIERLTGLVEMRYFVWQHDPNTPLAPPDAEARFQQVMARYAAPPVADLWFQEWGWHNRCWHRWCTLKVTKFFADKLGQPVDSRIEPYLSFHEPLIAKFGASDDNSSNYIWVGFRYLVQWGMASDTLGELAKHQGAVQALHAWRRCSSPSGAVPNWASGNGWFTGAGEALKYYELMGALTGDGRFRWQAQRIAEYAYNHMWPRHDQYHLIRDDVAQGFTKAWLLADDAVKPVPVEAESGVTTRWRMVPTTSEERAATPGLASHKLLEERVPDKLILSSGTAPTGLWGMVEVTDWGGHSGQLPGAIMALMQNDAALQANQGYFENTPDFNNIVWIEDLEGIPAEAEPMRCEITRFVEDPLVTYARIHAPRYQQLPVDYTRDIVFVKNGFLLVKDYVTFHKTMKVRVGPGWQTRDLGPQSGPDWFNTYYEWLYLTGLGLGNGVHAFRNPAWDLLVRFAPRADTEIKVLDRYAENPWRPSPTRVRQEWTGIARAGETRTFTTVLLPHTPALQVQEYADAVQILTDNDGVTLVRVTTEVDKARGWREQHWLLLQEEPGAVAEGGGLRSNARLALVSRDQRGQLKRPVLVEGTVLSLEGEDLVARAGKPAVQVVYQAK